MATAYPLVVVLALLVVCAPKAEPPDPFLDGPSIEFVVGPASPEVRVSEGSWELFTTAPLPEHRGLEEALGAVGACLDPAQVTLVSPSAAMEIRVSSDDGHHRVTGHGLGGGVDAPAIRSCVEPALATVEAPDGDWAFLVRPRGP